MSGTIHSYGQYWAFAAAGLNKDDLVSNSVFLRGIGGRAALPMGWCLGTTFKRKRGLASELFTCSLERL